MAKKCVLILFVLLTACLGEAGPGSIPGEALPTKVSSPTASPLPRLPTQRATSAPPTPVPDINPSLWFEDSVPPGLRAQLQVAAPVELAASKETATLQLGVVHAREGTAAWVYVLAAPFPTLVDSVRLKDLRDAWLGKSNELFNQQSGHLLVSASTKAAFEAKWGKADEEVVQVNDENVLLDQAWEALPGRAWAILPFEEVEPRWKVLRIDGASPLDKDFDLETYPLVARFGLRQRIEPGLVILPPSNRDPRKLTVLVMTGVTALVRAIGAKMEELGMSYPGEGIKDWLRYADLTHVSNEVSFDRTCPPANPNQYSLMFCSRPQYLELLRFVGVDIVELTGNHLMDFRVDSLPYSLALFRQYKMQYYGAGENIQEARRPLKIEHHGNKIAFLGCNPAGPPGDWASEARPGTADCSDYGWVIEEIGRLQSEGYLPVVTLQYYEIYHLSPSERQARDFSKLAESGAVIVSGSQAHHPQGFAFVGDHLIHYGLGNLFFDQMYMPENSGKPEFSPELPLPGTRLEFIDRHVFYDGRYLGVELLTAILEDYARPRPMDASERAYFLREVFLSSGWNIESLTNSK